MAKTNKCKDCTAPCDKRCERCQSCSNKLNGKSRPRNPKHCKKCGTELAKRKYALCHSCNMKKRWANKEYGSKVRASMRASFDSRWNDPATQKKMIKVLTNFTGTSKLEKWVAKVATQFGYKSSVAIGRYLADLLNEDKKVVVEVNGDYWHCNPKLWEPTAIHPFKKITAQEIWDHDSERAEFLKSLGYTIYVLWEQDLIKGKEKFVKNFFEKLNETKG